MRVCKAIISVSTGRSGVRQIPVQRVSSYMTQQSLDNDADSFSIDLGDATNELALCLDRDNEVRVQLYLDNERGSLVPIFKGIVDSAECGTDFLLSMEGRDEPSALAVDTDALFGHWKKQAPHKFIAGRAAKIGVTNVRIAKMSTIGSIRTDGSEKEWGLWYRLARAKGMYMWSDEVGKLIVDKLGFSLEPTYRFGDAPKGLGLGYWQAVVDFSQGSNKQGRIQKVLVYGEDAKKGRAIVAQSIDPSIASWKRKPLSILTDTAAKNQNDLKKTADDEVFESIVGTQEIELTIHDSGLVIEQNKMAVVNLPKYGIDMEPWFVVGVQRRGGLEGMTQVVRLRERGFAISKRVPKAPVLKNAKDSAADKPTGSIAAALAQSGVKWADSFVRATMEFGDPAGWDSAVFLGTLLSICQVESSFHNIRGIESGAINRVEWMPYDRWVNSGERLKSDKTSSELFHEYQRTFANERRNPLSPRHPNSNTAVGPMQLVSDSYVIWADEFGWNGAKKTGEYDGGRWNPDSNIRAAARALVQKLNASPPANPNEPNTIWLGVERYYGSGNPTDDQAYAASVRKQYKALYETQASGAIAIVKPLPVGSTDTAMNIPGYGALRLPDSTPDPARKAINFALGRFGDPYEWGGAGPNYDCSSFVTAALASGAAYLRNKVDEPRQEPKYHGDNTYTLWKKGRFTDIAKDELLPGDLVFFRGDPPEHVGMYLYDGLFIAAPSTGNFVRVASMNDGYYADKFSGARRVITWTSRPG